MEPLILKAKQKIAINYYFRSMHNMQEIEVIDSIAEVKFLQQQFAGPHHKQAEKQPF